MPNYELGHSQLHGYHYYLTTTLQFNSFRLASTYETHQYSTKTKPKYALQPLLGQ